MPRGPRATRHWWAPVLVAVVAVGVLAGCGPARASGSVSVETNVQYGSSSLQDLDAYLPSSSSPVPAVIFVHGGSWDSGDKSNLDQEAESVAAIGWAGFSINYRLAGFPTEIEDVLSAISWIRDNASQFNVDPTRLALLGTSAGGNLVGMAATDAAAYGGDLSGVRAAVTWSGPMDLGALVQQSDADIQGLISRYVCGDQAGCSQSSYDQASPITFVSGSSLPMYLVNSSDEVIPLGQATSMADKLQAAGVANQVKVIQGDLHAEAYAPEAFTPSVDFLSTYLGQYSGSVPAVTASDAGGIPGATGSGSRSGSDTGNGGGGGQGPGSSSTGATTHQSVPPTAPASSLSTRPPTGVPTTQLAVPATGGSSGTNLLTVLLGVLGAALLGVAGWLLWRARVRHQP